MNTNFRTIGFIGTGIMGKSMAGHLLKAGHPLLVYTRSANKANELLDQGAKWCSSPAELAKQAQVIITMIGYPKDVEEVYLGENGILKHAASGTIVIDMTTSSPELAARIALEAKKYQIGALDAPVTGGDIGARDAKLSILVGGDAATYESALPILQLMGINIGLLGPAGSGQHGKMCNQIVTASTMMGVCEGLLYAQTAGLDANQVLKVMSSGAASGVQLNTQCPKMVKGDFAPGFMAEHFLKDLSIAIGECERMKLHMPGLIQAKKLYTILLEQGMGREGFHALFKLYLNQQTH